MPSSGTLEPSLPASWSGSDQTSEGAGSINAGDGNRTANDTEL